MLNTMDEDVEVFDYLDHNEIRYDIREELNERKGSIEVFFVPVIIITKYRWKSSLYQQ